MLAGFLGYHIITRVPPLLHTPLMSATNAIAAISLVGSLVVAGSDYSNVPNGWVCTLLGFVAVTCSATNAVGGFLITDRMLRMFKTAEERARGNAAAGRAAGVRRRPRPSSRVVAALLYATKPAGHGDGRVPPRARRRRRRCATATSSRRRCSSSGLKGLSSPKWARARHGCWPPSACSSPWSARSSIRTSSPTGGSALGLLDRRGGRRHDGPAHPDDRGAAAHRAVALAGRAGGVSRRHLGVLPLPGRARAASR